MAEKNTSMENGPLGTVYLNDAVSPWPEAGSVVKPAVVQFHSIVWVIASSSGGSPPQPSMLGS
ncbi:MAG: hypothetical protein BWX54_01622 [Verrucomicrobia bacterium ADurb.Bin018]|nr:MAG: hypothetical protein BWX54_01622 [Verrucomicrobia bacterium ADurb.Bin018]